MSNIINFAVPGMYEHAGLNFDLLNIYKKNPEYFMDGVGFDAFYGNFQFCIFDGGRVFEKYSQTTAEEIYEIVHTYNDIFNVPIRLIFTSNQLKPEHFTDRFSNVVLQICENEMNQIVLVNDELKKYIQDKYPAYTYISSTTKCLTSPKDFKEELTKDDFFEVCLDYNLNKNKQLLESLSPEERDKCEFLINAICPAGCPYRKNHYRLNSLLYLNYGKAYRVPGCPVKDNTLHPDTENSVNNLSPEEIYNWYAPNGFKHFKLEGRTLPATEVACNYVRYMIKPEYQLYVLNILLNHGQ